MRDAAIVIIENSEGQILLMDRATKPFGWSLPGGKTEKTDKGMDNTAIREVYEETGLRLLKAFLVFLGTDKSENGRTIYLYSYKLTGKSGPDKPIPNISDEHLGYKWVDHLPDDLAYAGSTKKFFNKYKFKHER